MPLERKEPRATDASRVPEAFLELINHHLPPEQNVGPRGGRHPVPHRLVVRVLWHVLATGCR